MPSILLRFAGPLQSWGSPAIQSTRPTDLYPTKSAVQGMIAAAMGLPRSEIHQVPPFHFGVRVDQPGRLLKDYQTLTRWDKPSSKTKWLSDRYYIEDGSFLVLIHQDDPEIIQTIYQALKRPVYPLYMGRRSNPIPLDFIQGVFDHTDPLTLLKTYDRKNPATCPMYVDSSLCPNESYHYRQDRRLPKAYPSFSLRKETTLYAPALDLFDLL